ncbi:MAG: hypothetical protein GF364_13935 [Candidatus Lokiarchaeota archaeon]|nr:hypothetical protein [Candidatus Lokiarchaeota archaeon]
MAKKSKSKTKKRSKHSVLKKLRNDITINDLEQVREMFEKRLAQKKGIEYIKRDDIIEINDVKPKEALKRIENVVKDIVRQILVAGDPSFKIPIRTSSNIIYDAEQDLILLGQKEAEKKLLTLTSVQDATRVMKVMEIIYKQCLKTKKHMTKREVFYGAAKLFQDQKYSDSAIEDVSALIRTTRNSTGVVAKARGSAVGRLKLRDGNEIIDLEKQGSGAWSISPFLDRIEVLESDAEFILVLEKDAAMMRIIEEKWWTKFPCIALTAEGVGNVATRMFLKKINATLKLPTFCLVDCDPYGHYIYSVYIRGSKRLSYESPFLATPDMHLLGVLTRDLDEFGIGDDQRIPMDKRDLKRLNDMLNEDFVKNNKKWKDDLQLMKKNKQKAEIQALSSHGIEYITDTYLPNKLYSGDWI